MRDEPLREELLHVLASSQPPAGRIRHHGILRIRGHEYVLDGYLVYSHGDGFRLRASDPMAATLLDVAETSRTTPLVFTDNIGLGRGRFLQGGPLRVARALTTIPDADRLDLGHESSGTLALSGGDWRFLFDPSSHVLAGMQCTKADSILLDIKVERSASFSRWEGPAPRLLKVRSYSPAYELTLEVLDVAPFPAARDYLERRVP